MTCRRVRRWLRSRVTSCARLDGGHGGNLSAREDDVHFWITASDRPK